VPAGSDMFGSSVAQTTDKTRDAMRHWPPMYPLKHAASESANLRKQELECLRLETDCLQLAIAIHSPALKSHFIRMARKWSVLAAGGLEHAYRGEDLN